MNTTRFSQALLVAVIGSVALIGCKKKDEAAAAPPAVAPGAAQTIEAPAATVAVTGVALGTSENVAIPSTSFAPSDASIYAVVSTQTSDAAASVPGTLAATWSHVDSGQTVSEDSRDLIFTDSGSTVFQINKSDGWPKGNYRLVVSLGGNTVQTVDFEVK